MFKPFVNFNRLKVKQAINNSKDSIEYSFIPFSGLHELRTPEIDGEIFAVQMHRDSILKTHFAFKHTINGKSYVLPPCQLTYFETKFIERMYSKMLLFYVEKNGMPIHQNCR